MQIEAANNGYLTNFTRPNIPMSFLDTFLSKRNKNPLGEMSFTDHIDDLRGHIIRSILVIIIFAIVAFLNIDWIFQQIIFAPSQPGFVSNVVMCDVAHKFGIESQRDKTGKGYCFLELITVFPGRSICLLCHCAFYH